MDGIVHVIGDTNFWPRKVKAAIWITMTNRILNRDSGYKFRLYTVNCTLCSSVINEHLEPMYCMCNGRSMKYVPLFVHVIYFRWLMVYPTNVQNCLVHWENACKKGNEEKKAYRYSITHFLGLQISLKKNILQMASTSEKIRNKK